MEAVSKEASVLEQLKYWDRGRDMENTWALPPAPCLLPCPDSAVIALLLGCFSEAGLTSL